MERQHVASVGRGAFGEEADDASALFGFDHAADGARIVFIFHFGNRSGVIQQLGQQRVPEQGSSGHEADWLVHVTINVERIPVGYMVRQNQIRRLQAHGIVAYHLDLGAALEKCA